MARKSLFLLVSLIVAALMFCPTSNAENFNILWQWWGGIDVPHVWLDSQDIRIGDRLEFLVITDYDNLLQVTRENYEACNIKNPIARWDNLDYNNPGVFSIPDYGHFYFISGMPGACEGGMKIQVYVPDPHSSAPVQSPSPDPSLSSAPAPSSSSFAN